MEDFKPMGMKEIGRIEFEIICMTEKLREQCRRTKYCEGCPISTGECCPISHLIKATDIMKINAKKDFVTKERVMEEELRANLTNQLILVNGHDLSDPMVQEDLLKLNDEMKKTLGISSLGI